MNRAVVAGIASVAVVVAAPAVATADGTDLDAWHEDALLRLVVPLGPSAFKDHVGFGGAVGFRAYHGPLELLGEAAIFTRTPPAAIAEVLGYRFRALAGYRLVRELSVTRAVILRAAGGVELGGFEDQATYDWWVEEHRFGAAVELGAESRTVVEWGGVISLHVAFAVSAQPFGDDEVGESRYVGVELLAGASIGW